MSCMQGDQVEILLATYNGERYLTEQVESILSQTYQNWVLKIRDDCSRDATASIVRSYVEKYPDKIMLVGDGTASGGAKNNFFRLMSLSDGQYIMFCDQDDVWEPNKIELTLKRMKELEKEKGSSLPLLVFTDLRVVNENLETIASSFERMSHLDCTRTQLPRLLVQNVVTGCTAMMNAALREIAVQAKDLSRVTMHDGWVALIASAFGASAYLPVQTICYRQHGDNSVGAKKTLSPSYVWDKLFVNNDLRASLSAMRLQALEFYDCYADQMDDQTRVLVEEFCSQSSAGKLGRLRTTIHGGFWKHGAMRKVAQILWC